MFDFQLCNLKAWAKYLISLNFSCIQMRFLICNTRMLKACPGDWMRYYILTGAQSLPHHRWSTHRSHVPRVRKLTTTLHLHQPLLAISQSLRCLLDSSVGKGRGKGGGGRRVQNFTMMLKRTPSRTEGGEPWLRRPINKHTDINSTLKIRYCDSLYNNRSWLTDSLRAFWKKGKRQGKRFLRCWRW